MQWKLFRGDFLEAPGRHLEGVFNDASFQPSTLFIIRVWKIPGIVE